MTRSLTLIRRLHSRVRRRALRPNGRWASTFSPRDRTGRCCASRRSSSGEAVRASMAGSSAHDAPRGEARFDRRRAGGARSPDGPGDQGVLGFRVDGRLSLSARAQRPALDLGHRRLLVPWHCAWRRGADRRHVGDERLSPRPDGQVDRPQWPHVPARGRDAADRLRCGDGRGEQGSRRHFGAAAGRGPGVRELPLWLIRRAGARHSRKRSRAPAGRRGPHHPGLARRL